MNTVISFEQLVQDFDSLFRRRVFRLETLDYYDAPNEHEPYRRFLAGRPADWAWREPWKKIVHGHRASGRIMQRVHVVSEPVSDYIRFELLRAYPASVEAGEDVRIIGRSAASDDLPGRDFWLFDDDRAAGLVYNGNGIVERVFMFGDDLAHERFMMRFLRETRDKALRLAAPLAQYVEEHNITEERAHAS